MRPREDVDILFFKHRFELRAVVLVPLLMASVEETADQQISLPDAAMVRSYLAELKS